MTHRIDKLIKEITRFHHSYTIEENGCWNWKFTKNKDGYGMVFLDGTSTAAHRFSWFLDRGMAPPRDMYVCHACDNPLCVNPAHLWLGTPTDNARDMWKKGRQNYNSKITKMKRQRKLTTEQVLEIRNSTLPLKDLSRQYNTCIANVSLIRRGLRKQKV